MKFSGATSTSKVELTRKGLLSLVLRSNNRFRVTSALPSRGSICTSPPSSLVAQSSVLGIYLGQIPGPEAPCTLVLGTEKLPGGHSSRRAQIKCGEELERLFEDKPRCVERTWLMTFAAAKVSSGGPRLGIVVFPKRLSRPRAWLHLWVREPARDPRGPDPVQLRSSQVSWGGWIGAPRDSRYGNQGRG